MKGTIFDLSGKVALVTGGSKGIGKAIAHAFAEAGADIVICSRHQEQLRAALDEIYKDTGVRGHYFVTDLSQRPEAEALARSTLEATGRVDILVNNAGANVLERIDEVTDQNWDRILELNLNSCMALTRALVPQMKQRGWGRVIHISSVMALSSRAGRSAYSATKSALVGMTRASALDLGPDKITVNCIAPGPFLTDMPRADLSDEQLTSVASLTALGRWADVQELAGPVLLLASEAGSYITGSVLVVDGGILCRIF